MRITFKASKTCYGFRIIVFSIFQIIIINFFFINGKQAKSNKNPVKFNSLKMENARKIGHGCQIEVWIIDQHERLIRVMEKIIAAPLKILIPSTIQFCLK